MPLSHGQKVFFITAVAVIGITAVGLSVRQWSRGLVIAPPSTASSPAQSTPPLEGLKNKDTDGDGLSDYDELFAYGTSPYLKDTDSDGILDGVEVQNGTNPNCPEGKNCLTQGGLSNPAVTPTEVNTAPQPSSQGAPSAFTPQTAPGGLTTQQPVVSAPETQTSPEQLVRLMEGKATLSELRAYLKQQGASSSDLARIDDATLLDLYTKALGEMSASLTPNASAPQNSTTTHP